MIRVYYANKLWGEYPTVPTGEEYIDIPDGAYMYSDKHDIWASKGMTTDYLLEEDIPKETRLLNLLLSG